MNDSLYKNMLIEEYVDRNILSNLDDDTADIVKEIMLEEGALALGIGSAITGFIGAILKKIEANKDSTDKWSERMSALGDTIQYASEDTSGAKATETLKNKTYLLMNDARFTTSLTKLFKLKKTVFDFTRKLLDIAEGGDTNSGLSAIDSIYKKYEEILRENSLIAINNIPKSPYDITGVATIYGNLKNINGGIDNIEDSLQADRDLLKRFIDRNKVIQSRENANTGAKIKRAHIFKTKITKNLFSKLKILLKKSVSLLASIMDKVTILVGTRLRELEGAYSRSDASLKNNLKNMGFVAKNPDAGVTKKKNKNNNNRNGNRNGRRN